jgi:hypothetical protein
MTDKETALTASELRREARLILDQIKVTADREVKRRLAVRAFELVQQAEQLLGDQEQRLGQPEVA